MTLSRRERERLRAIEERLEMEDPEYSARVERFCARLPERSQGWGTDSAPHPGLVALWAAAIAGGVLLVVIAVFAPEPASSSSGDAGSGATPTAPGAEFSRSSPR